MLPEEAVWIYSDPKAREWKQAFKSTSFIQALLNIPSKLPKEAINLHLGECSERSQIGTLEQRDI